MQIPLHFYLIEIKSRFYYYLCSFITCLIITFNYHEAIFFWSTYSFSFVNEGRFIATHIAELFSSYIYISIIIVPLFNFPYACYHCNCFFYSSWYKSQTWFFITMQIFTFFIFCISIFICYFFILPYAYAFLDTWNITTIYAFKVQLEARIETYICWMFQTTCLISNIIYFFSTRIMYFYLMDNMINLHILYRKNKKYLLFFIIFISFVCLPSESSIQLYLFCFILLLWEILFFISCLFFAKNNV